MFFVFLKASFSLKLSQYVFYCRYLQALACCISGSSSENVYYNERIGVRDPVHVADVDRT